MFLFVYSNVRCKIYFLHSFALFSLASTHGLLLHELACVHTSLHATSRRSQNLYVHMRCLMYRVDGWQLRMQRQRKSSKCVNYWFCMSNNVMIHRFINSYIRKYVNINNMIIFTFILSINVVNYDNIYFLTTNLEIFYIYIYKGKYIFFSTSI